MDLLLSSILWNSEIVQDWRKETGGEDGGVLKSISMDAKTPSTSSSPSGFSSGTTTWGDKETGGEATGKSIKQKKTMNVTEILDNIKETYKSWACCQGEVQKECEKQLFVDLPVQ